MSLVRTMILLLSLNLFSLNASAQIDSLCDEFIESFLLSYKPCKEVKKEFKQSLKAYKRRPEDYIGELKELQLQCSQMWHKDFKKSIDGFEIQMASLDKINYIFISYSIHIVQEYDMRNNKDYGLGILSNVIQIFSEKLYNRVKRK